ncbi:MAG: alpha/beta fold hydrolase [Solirubrobacteraceae bacterium]
MTATAPSDTYGAEGRSEWLDIDWREHQRWVEVKGAPINVIEMGSGPPLIFIHGLGGAWQNWLENIPHFARTHRVIAIDLPGFGASPDDDEKTSISGYAELVDALCDDLDIERASVVGNSMGGFIGAELAIAFATRIERLVLVSPAGISTENLHRRPLITGARIAGLGASWVGSKSEVLTTRPRMRRALAWNIVRHPHLLSAPLMAEQVRGTGKPGFIDALDALMSYPIRDRLEKIECPTLIVWGRNDFLVPVRDADEFEKLIPNSRKVIWDDTGHVAMLERPAKFNALVDEFLAAG